MSDIIEQSNTVNMARFYFEMLKVEQPWKEVKDYNFYSEVRSWNRPQFSWEWMQHCWNRHEMYIKVPGKDFSVLN
jgi:hypothetical protein